MRKQSEFGLDPYSIFNPLWYAHIQKEEPNIGIIMNKVFEKYQSYHWEWNKEEYLKRIGK